MPSPSSIHPTRWNFAIDQYLNPIVPPSILPRVPYVIAHFFGYRPPHPPPPPADRKPPPGNISVVFITFVGIFLTLSVIGAVGKQIPMFTDRGVPTIIGSFGAAAVLDFYAIESPLAQPRNALVGQLLSSVVGIGIGKLLQLGPDFEATRWLGAALSCAAATAVMALTGTVHPPAGATALMAVMDDSILALGWFMLAPVMLGCALMLAMALLVNNVQRRFPLYWWSPEATGARWRRGQGIGSGSSGGSSSSGSSNGMEEKGKGAREDDGRAEDREEEGVASSSVALTVSEVEEGGTALVVIGRGTVQIPAGLALRPEERLFLETLSQRL